VSPEFRRIIITATVISFAAGAYLGPRVVLSIFIILVLVGTLIVSSDRA
jgi:hypothetical protein